VRPEARGRYHAVKFSNSTLGTTWKIYDAEMKYRGGKEE
jgi:hypothetical protein